MVMLEARSRKFTHDRMTDIKAISIEMLLAAKIKTGSEGT